jgi:hypothetical protein
MLSNQLPLLEAGQDPQEITGRRSHFCEPGAAQADQRFIGRTKLIAFSDPNDIMSYPIPEDWADKYIESRLCPEITNVTINIAHVRSVFGLGEFADPLEAHLGYASDARVGGLIADGAGHDDVAPVVSERCRWLATDEALMQ